MKALVHNGPGERGWDTVDDRRSFGVGVLNGMVSPGDVGAVVGAGPIGLAPILTARLYTPAQIVAIDPRRHRRQGAQRVGADVTVDNSREDAVARDPRRHDHRWTGRYVQHPAAHSGREPPGPSSSRARLARGARRRDPGRRPLRASMLHALIMRAHRPFAPPPSLPRRPRP